MNDPARLVPMLALFVLGAGAFPAAVHGALHFGPYLQSLRADTVLVCAWVDDGDGVSVELETPGSEPRRITAEGTTPACARLDGLRPNVDYRYALRVNGECASGACAPGEAPLTFVARSEPEQTFVIYGDTRSGDESFDLAHRQVVQGIRRSTVADAILHTGDFVERGGDRELWENFFLIEEEILSTAPIFPAIGRSDQPPELMRRIFPRLAESPWYAIDRGEVHVAVLHLWQSRRQGPDAVSPEGAQATWLREDLAGARRRGAKHLFVVMHEPVIDVDGKTPPTIRDVFMPIFEAFQVTAVFSGAHYFSHAVVNGVHYLTNGGGGARLEARQPEEGIYRFHSAVHHFLVLEVDPFRARLRGMNAHGEEFYGVTFDEAPGALADHEAPTFVMTFPGGVDSVAATAFILPGCEPCEALEVGLRAAALRTGATLLVTFRSLEDAGNRALLRSLTEVEGPTPIVDIDGAVLIGADEIAGRLDDAIGESLAHPARPAPATGRWIPLAAAAVALAGAAWLVHLGLQARRRARRERP